MKFITANGMDFLDTANWVVGIRSEKKGLYEIYACGTFSGTLIKARLITADNKDHAKQILRALLTWYADDCIDFSDKEDIRQLLERAEHL